MREPPKNSNSKKPPNSATACRSLKQQDLAGLFGKSEESTVSDTVKMTTDADRPIRKRIR